MSGMLRHPGPGTGGSGSGVTGPYVPLVTPQQLQLSSEAGDGFPAPPISFGAKMTTVVGCAVLTADGANDDAGCRVDQHARPGQRQPHPTDAQHGIPVTGTMRAGDNRTPMPGGPGRRED